MLLGLIGCEAAGPKRVRPGSSPTVAPKSFLSGLRQFVWHEIKGNIVTCFDVNNDISV